MAVRLSALQAGHPIAPGRFLVLISVRGWVDPRIIVWLEGLGQLRKVHLIGTLTHDLPACSIVSQPTTLPHAPNIRANKSSVISLHWWSIIQDNISEFVNDSGLIKLQTTVSILRNLNTYWNSLHMLFTRKIKSLLLTCNWKRQKPMQN
jgi:hypothetical protein